MSTAPLKTPGGDHATELEHHATEDRRRRPSCREGVCDKKVGLCEDMRMDTRRNIGVEDH